ncbi:MAG: hypothetical protein E7333_07605 [Clostridiales bacterium]|nr:hypothetical protein [Clostridiales bacterium]
MMNVLLLSDLHGAGESLRRSLPSIQRMAGKLDGCLFMGDGLNDFRRILPDIRRLGDRMVIQDVVGNCDYGADAPHTSLVNLSGVRTLVTHGHRYHVKHSLLTLEMEALQHDCLLAAYGHTHVQDAQPGRVALVNPGSAGSGKAALLTIQQGEGNVTMLDISAAMRDGESPVKILSQTILF